MRLWYNAWGSMQNPGLSQFMASRKFITGSWDSVWEEQSLFEAPVNVLYARSDPTGPFGELYGFFRPPSTSDYTFVLAVDDIGSLWMGNQSFNISEMEMIISVTTYVPSREW